MRNFDHSEEFRDICFKAVQNIPYPVQSIWGVEDPLLSYDRYGKEIKESAHLDEIHQLKAGHFLQEEQWEVIAEKIKELADNVR